MKTTNFLYAMLLFFATCSLATASDGKITVSPTEPTTDSEIYIETFVCVGSAPAYIRSVEVSQGGDIININMKIEMDAFAVGDCVSATTHLGKLAAGSYTVVFTVQRRDFFTPFPYGPQYQEAEKTFGVAAIALPLLIEYRNVLDFPTSPGGHFFYTADPQEQDALDSGLAGNFERTGTSFASGGPTQVCRFYGSTQPGPNSHFFTADADECDALRSRQLFPVPTDEQQWNYEGRGFSVTPTRMLSGTTQCPAQTRPVYRAYNKAYATGGKQAWDSNHRFSLAKAEVDSLVNQYGWEFEGIGFCVPK